MKRTLLLAMGFLLPLMSLYAQNQSDNDTLQILRDHHGKVSSLVFNPDTRSVRRIANEKDILLKITEANPGADDLELISTRFDDLGMVHHKYQQRYKGVKVEYAQYIAHGKLSIESINGTMESITGLDVTPAFNSDKAIDIAKGYFKAEKLAYEDSALVAFYYKYRPEISLKPTAELMITRANINDRDSFCLAYKVSLAATQPVKSGFVYVNANDGSIIKYITDGCNYAVTSAVSTNAPANKPISVANKDQNKSNAASGRANSPATFETRYSGTVSAVTDSYGGSYLMREIRNGVGLITYNNNYYYSPAGATNYSDNDNNWTAAEMTNSRAALDLHSNIELILDYYQNVRGKSSVDGAGRTISAFSHWGSSDNPANTTAVANASYMSNYDGYFFGDGGAVGFIYIYPLTSIDIVGHELEHGVIKFLAGLIYEKQSGALNESLADIAGTVEKAAIYPLKNRWGLGAEISSSIPMRLMDNPNGSGVGAQPDTYLGTNWVSTTSCTPNTTNDQCGVHTNSGVINYWFYLFANGGSGTNDVGSAFNVQGIGITTAGAIVFRALDLYLTSGTQFSDWRNMVIQAARDLYGVGSCQEIAATNAFYAVNIGGSYVSPNINQSVTSICPTGTFSLSFVPTGGTVAWSLTPGLTTTTSGTGNTFTATRYGTTTGTGTATATITLAACSMTVVSTGTFRVGSPDVIGTLFKRENAGNNCGWDIYTYLPVGADNVQISINGGSTWSNISKTWNSTLGQWECKVDVNVEGPATVSYLLRSTNNCGNSSSSTKSITVTRRSSGCLARMANKADTTIVDSTARFIPNAGTEMGKGDIIISPNPNSGQFNVRFDNSAGKTGGVTSVRKITHVKVSSLSGYPIYEYPVPGQGQEIVTVNLSNRTPGTYILTISDGQTSKSKKFIIH